MFPSESGAALTHVQLARRVPIMLMHRFSPRAKFLNSTRFESTRSKALLMVWLSVHAQKADLAEAEERRMPPEAFRSSAL